MTSPIATRLLSLAFFALAASQSGAAVVADFETGTLAPGWSVSGAAWTVGGSTGTLPNINPQQGSFFARSGAPNVASETAIGVLTSAALTATGSTLQWYATGWSGQFGNGLNRFEVLDAGLGVVATVAAPLSDSWSLQSVDLYAAGVSPGGTFYLQAIDGYSATTYAWIALDNVQVVPEPSRLALALAGMSVLALGVGCRRRKREQQFAQAT